MNIDPDEASRSLAAIETSRSVMRSVVRAHRGHYYLWLWGVLWAVMAMVVEFRGERGLPLLNWISGGGMVGSVFIGISQSGRIRAPIDKRFVAALAAFFGFAVICPFLLGFPTDPKAIFAYIAFVFMMGYIISGLWFDIYLVWTGLVVAVAILTGFLFFHAFFWWWIALFGGGTLVGTGFYVRYGWRERS